MERTAEEFVHQLPDGRWFVGDYEGPHMVGCPMPDGGFPVYDDAEIPTIEAVKKYTTKRSAKRAAQRWLERTLDATEDDENEYETAERDADEARDDAYVAECVRAIADVLDILARSEDDGWGTFRKFDAISLRLEPMRAHRPAVTHSSDADCLAAGTVDENGDCRLCGVTGGDPCPVCGGDRYHNEGCDPIARERLRASLHFHRGCEACHDPACADTDTEDFTKGA